MITKINTEKYIETQERLTKDFLIDSIKERINNLVHDNLLSAGEIKRLIKMEVE